MGRVHYWFKEASITMNPVRTRRGRIMKQNPRAILYKYKKHVSCMILENCSQTFLVSLTIIE
jgi:hypothetical protein